jgi:hypothetical protein
MGFEIISEESVILFFGDLLLDVYGLTGLFTPTKL